MRRKKKTTPYTRYRGMHSVRPIGSAAGILVPTSRVVRMRFCDNSATLAIDDGKLVFGTAARANDPYAPIGSTASSAYGFDQYSEFYTSFLVIGAKIRVDWMPGEGAATISQGTTTMAGTFWAEAPNAAPGAGFTDYQAFIEAQYGSWVSIPDPRAGSTGFSGGRKIFRTNANYSFKKLYGSSYQEGADDLGGRTSSHALGPASPAVLNYFTLWLSCFDGSGSGALPSGAWIVNFVVDYLVLFQGPVPLIPD